uniref:Uncharacterized protein n=1 Tax=Triticum urartu TaxID=4572 RepID=A0A8R7RDL3_TRIUA
VVHDEAELVGYVVERDAAEADDVRVAAARLEEAGLPQHLAGVGGVVEGLDGDDLAGRAAPRLDDGAELASAEARLLVVVIGGPDDAPPLPAHRARLAGVAVEGRGGSLAGERHRIDRRAEQR